MNMSECGLNNARGTILINKKSKFCYVVVFEDDEHYYFLPKHCMWFTGVQKSHITLGPWTVLGTGGEFL